MSRKKRNTTKARKKQETLQQFREKKQAWEHLYNSNQEKAKKADKSGFKKDLGQYLKETHFFKNHKEGVLLDVIQGNFDPLANGAIVYPKKNNIEISILSHCEEIDFMLTIRLAGLSLSEIRKNLSDTGVKGKRLRLIELHQTHKMPSETYTVINAKFEDVNFKKGHLWLGCPYWFSYSSAAPRIDPSILYGL